MANHQRDRPTVGVLVGYQVYHGSLNPYLIPLFRGIRSAACSQGCNLLLACGVNHYMRPGFRLAWPIPSAADTDFVPVGPWNTDGLLVVLPTNSEERSAYLQGLIARGFPVVFISAGEEGPTVAVDNEDGVYKALAHLRAHGHQQVAFIAGQPDDPGDSAVRLQAYLAAVRKYKLDFHPDLVAYGDHSYDGGQKAMEALLETRVPFTAVLASNDESAVGAMHVLQDAGRRIPEDVAVIGFDDQVDAMAQTSPLTTVRCPSFDLGYKAQEMLFQYIEGEDVAEEVVRLPVELIVRRSCGCRPGAWVSSSGEGDTGKRRAAKVNLTQEIEQAMAAEVLTEAEHLSLEEVHVLCHRLVSAFFTSRETGDATSFRLELEDVTQQVEAAGDHLYAWQQAITALKEKVSPFMDDDQATHALLEELLQQARETISEGMQRQHILHQMRQVAVVRQLGFMTAHFLAAKDEKEILKGLDQHARDMGFLSTAVAFYEPDGDDAVAHSLVYYGAEARTKRIPTRAFPPPELASMSKPLHLALLPLTVDPQTSGCVAFEIDDVESMGPGAAIVLQLTSALRSVRMYWDAIEGRRLAEEANRMKGRFLSTVSHELRTPLNLVVGLSEMLLDDLTTGKGTFSEDHRMDLERIHVSAQHLDGLIRDVLDLARSDMGRLKLVCEPLDLAEMLEAVAVVGEQMARDKGLSWHVEIPDDLPQVWGDRTRLRQVLLNLINNAVKFTTEGGIDLKATAEGDMISVSVRDTGLGIPRQEQAVIFDEFHQSERTTARGYGGLGLGLAICRQLVELQGGKITVSSSGEEGAGSTFTFTLPIMEDSPGSSQEDDLSLDRENKVLLVTGQPDEGKQIKEHLARQGFEVEVEVYQVGEKTEWLSRLLSRPPGAVLLDPGLASDWGWEVLNVLKGNPATRDIPVLFYALEQGEDRGSVLALDYLTKPVDTEQLAEALKRLGLGVRNDGEPEERTVLVVDDEPGILQMHARIIRSRPEPYRVLTARNGREGLELIKQQHPDLVLLDLMMPEMDGFDVLEAMREDPSCQDIPVIVLTSQTLTEDDMARLNRGVAAVLRKGLFSTDETLTHVEQALTQSKKLGDETQRLVRRAMAYLHEHYAEPISLEETANYVGASKEYLSRCFHQETGVTLVSYLNRYRVDRAKQLLKGNATSIAEVALDVGFSSPSYFSRVFRQEVGMSPSAYRKRR